MILCHFCFPLSCIELHGFASGKLLSVEFGGVGLGSSSETQDLGSD